MVRCKHAWRAREAYRIDAVTGKTTEAIGPMLCVWWNNVSPLLGTVPPWLTRNAGAGHLLNYPDDCTSCPVYEKAPPEDPHNSDPGSPPKEAR